MPKWTDVNSSLNPSWDFKKDAVLIGVLVSKKENVGLNNSKIFVFEHEKDHKKYTVWGSKVLDKIFEIPVGSLMRIEYLGDVKGKGPKPYHNYAIQVDEDSKPATPEEAESIMNF